MAGGVYNIGASVGSMLAPPLVGWAILTHSWQAAFVITGAIGLVWVALWLLFYQSPDKHPQPLRRRAPLHRQRPGAAPAGRWLAPVDRAASCERRNFWGIAIPRMLADPTWGTLTFWVPLYLTTVRGFDLKQIAMFAWLPFLAADIGCIFGGTISSDAAEDVGVSLINARKWAFTLGALLMVGRGVRRARAEPVRGDRAAEPRRASRIRRCRSR